jgi:hypothetical protein
MALGWRKEYFRYRDVFLNIVNLYKKRQDLKIYLEILLSLGTISIFTAFALRPTVITIAELYKEIKNKENIVIKLDEKIKNLALAEELFKQEESKINLTKTSVPGIPIPESYVKQIEGLAIQNGLSLLGVSVGEVTLVGESKNSGATDTELASLPEGASGVTFSISVSGSYQQLSSFIGGLEKLRRPLKIDSLVISSSETEEGTNRLILLIGGRVPYLK